MPSPRRQLPVGRDEHHGFVAAGRQHDQRVVAESGRVDDFNAAGRTPFDTRFGLPFEHHHDRWVDLALGDGLSHPLHQAPRRTGPIAPPAGRPRPDDVGSIDEEHA